MRQKQVSQAQPYRSTSPSNRVPVIQHGQSAGDNSLGSVASPCLSPASLQGQFVLLYGSVSVCEFVTRLCTLPNRQPWGASRDLCMSKNRIDDKEMVKYENRRWKWK